VGKDLDPGVCRTPRPAMAWGMVHLLRSMNLKLVTVIQLLFPSILSFVLFHISHDGASTSMNYLINVAGEGKLCKISAQEKCL
jgi:hypothetical protein